MRKLILKISVSADGFVCGPQDEIDWIFRSMNKQVMDWIEKILWESDLHIMGSRTFRDMASYWPTSSDPLAKPMNMIPKLFFSRRGLADMVQADQTTRALRDKRKIDREAGISENSLSPFSDTWIHASRETDLVATIGRLKKQEGKVILAHGGAEFAQELVKTGLVDEYRLVIHPAILGKGKALFALAPHPLDLQLTSSSVFDSGVIANIYSIR